MSNTACVLLLHTMLCLLSGTYQILTKSLPRLGLKGGFAPILGKNPGLTSADFSADLPDSYGRMQPGSVSAITQGLARRLPCHCQYPTSSVSYYCLFPITKIIGSFVVVTNGMLDNLLIGLNYRENIPDNYKCLDKWGRTKLFNPHSQENRGLLLASYPCSFR